MPTHVPAGKRDALEHLLRYMARPALCQGRLMLREDGKVIWNLRKPWRDGTRSFVFDPLVFLERLVALIPHPREHQLTYHGCLARIGDADRGSNLAISDKSIRFEWRSAL